MKKEWYRENAKNIIKKLNSSDQFGLTEKKVHLHREKYGQNILSEEKRRSFLKIVLEQFNNPLIYVLIIADIIVFVLKDYIDAFIILFIILLNAVIGVFQEGKAERTITALKKVVKSYATVLRDGRQIRIADYEVVIGDILILKDGDTIPADARLIETNTLKVNESALTGESDYVLKDSLPLSPVDVKVSDQTNMVFRGTYVLSGIAKAIVVEVGLNTVIGQISKQLTNLHMDVPLKKNIFNLSKAIVTIIISISAFIFFYGVYIGNHDIKTMFITVVAITVSSIPESLPVIVTIVLATGVWRMSQKKVLVKKLQAVEALGQAKILALDKTGTITKNQMTVEKIFVNGRFFDVTGSGYEPVGEILEGDNIIKDVQKDKDLDLLIKTSVFTSIASTKYDKEKGIWTLEYGDPTEASLLVLGQKFNYYKDKLLKDFPQIFEIPFDMENKHHSTVNKIDNKNFLSVAGSPEIILKKCKKIYKDGKSVKILDSDFSRLEDVIKIFSKEGYRIIAVSYNSNSSEILEADKLPELTFLGFVAILDAIRPEVKSSVEAVKKAGMKVVMITGDHVETAKAIATKVGIYTPDTIVLSGVDMGNMTDEELAYNIEKVSVFARVTPKDKMRIIEAYKNRKEIIAMTGDGINDALSLITADLGISMGLSGTEVAREASDLVLLDDKFGNIIEAAEEGRNIYWNIKKSVTYLLSTNFGELAVIVIAIIVGMPLPLLAAQIIWLNLVTDTFLVSSLAVDPKEKGLLGEEFKRPGAYLLDKEMIVRMVILGSVMTLSTIFMFLKYVEIDYYKATTIALTTLTIFQWYNIFNIRSHKDSFFSKSLFSNKLLILNLILTICLHLFAIYHPFMQNILKTTPLDFKDWIIMIILGSSIIFIEEIRKFFYRSKMRLLQS